MEDHSYYFSDATPYATAIDIYDLFRFYNQYFFKDALHTTSVNWSKRMTSCAGICKYDGVASCEISLSEPLLKYRSNDDLKSTLLHEMIHAYLFMKEKRAATIDRGHGPKFIELMNQINAETGLSITVYHSFHEEVEKYRTHIWKCNGPCVQRPPYFGIVRRSMNRAPGKSDYWYEQHRRECGGQYTKISEPPKQIKPVKRKAITTSTTTSTTNTTIKSIKPTTTTTTPTTINKYLQYDCVDVQFEDSNEQCSYQLCMTIRQQSTKSIITQLQCIFNILCTYMPDLSILLDSVNLNEQQTGIVLLEGIKQCHIVKHYRCIQEQSILITKVVVGHIERIPSEPILQTLIDNLK